jgi:hypothetical protein
MLATLIVYFHGFDCRWARLKLALKEATLLGG